MTELEVLLRAKQYMSKLANGVNPLTDEEVAETDVVNQVRVSRCLFYVADVLQKVIDNGGKVSVSAAPPEPKKPKMRPYEISPDALKAFSFYSRPVAVSEMVRQLNDLSHEDDMKKLTYNKIAEWLLAEEIFCQTQDSTGRNTNRPTEKGRAIGISVEKRTGQHGEFWVVLFNREAQQYLIDHLQEVLVYTSEKKEKKQENAVMSADSDNFAASHAHNGKAFSLWSDDDDLFLRELYFRGASMGEMMLSLHRESSEISARIRALHLADET